MNAPYIIKEAMRLGILCRPCDMTGWCGEALEPEPDCFVRRSAGSTKYLGLWHPDPKHFLVRWEMLTKEMLDKEYTNSLHTPF